MEKPFELDGVNWNGFTKRLKQAREKAGLSLGKASRLCDLDRPHYARIERGKTRPTLPTLVKICKGFQITLSEFMLKDCK